MSVTVSIDMGALADLGPDAFDRAQAALVEAVVADCTQYVPVDTGALQASAVAGRDSVTWEEDYAEAVYNMDHVISARNPSGCPQWGEVARQAHQPEWEERVLEALGL